MLLNISTNSGLSILLHDIISHLDATPCDKGTVICAYTEGFISKFDLILYVPSTILQLCRDGSSWVEPVLS